MNNTVNLSELISRLASLTDTDTNTTRLFVREFFATVREALEHGEEVEIKNFGTFRRSDDPDQAAQGTVLFAPSAKLAREVNRPFAAFEPVVLAEGFDPEDVTPEDVDIAIEDTEDEPAPVTTETVVTEVPEIEETEPLFFEVPEDEAEADSETVTVTESEPVIEVDAAADSAFQTAAPELVEEPFEEPFEEPEPAYEPGHEPEYKASEDDSEVKTTPIPAPAPVPSFPEDDEEHDDEEPVAQPKGKSRAWLWWLLAACVIGCAGGYFAAMSGPSSLAEPEAVVADSLLQQDEAVTENSEATHIQTAPEPEAVRTGDAPAQEAAPVAAPAPAAAPATAPARAEAPAAPAEVYETVTPTNYLSIMARRHYGAQVYWVYIYEANADKLGHPDRIAPGTRVRIPDRSTIPGIGTPEGIRTAENKSRELRKRF